MEEKVKEIQWKLLNKLDENLETACTKELYEVVDMIKDMSEVLYYHEVVKAMKEKE